MADEEEKHGSPYPIDVVRTSLLARLLFLLQTLLFLASVGLAILSIGELAARESVLNQIQARITENRANYVDLTRSEVFASGGPSRPASVPVSSDETRRLQYNALIELSALSALRSRLQSIVIVGVESPSMSLRRIISDLQSTGAPRAESGQALSGEVLDFIQRARNTVTDLGSDSLLALAVMLAGAIGAMIASLRSGNALSLRAFVLGIASGFVTFLVLKGGKSILLFHTPDQMLMFNPYGAAFAGLLAGLFTERAHQILSVVVDDFVERVKGASQVRR